MIIIQFSGGLGNQISQYALLRLLQLKYNKKVLSDTSLYNKASCHQGFELPKLFQHIHLKEATLSQIIQIGKCIPYFSKKQIINKIISTCNKVIFFTGKNNSKYIQSYESGYPEDWHIFENFFDNKYMIGTFHNYNYNSIIEQLRQELTFPPLETETNINILKEIQSKNSVSVHVRRGDYVGLELNIIGIEYYKAAIQLISEKINHPHFYVFSDDSKWVKEEFTFLGETNYTIIDWNKESKSYVDMQLMSSCKHNIIANSTFSYWAAYLNSNPSKIVIRPEWQTPKNKTWNFNNWITL